MIELGEQINRTDIGECKAIEADTSIINSGSKRSS
tara:strand:- start:1675 stop:1779 length:105 start_codon:yes stop_codon:yes gene_type:complete